MVNDVPDSGSEALLDGLSLIVFESCSSPADYGNVIDCSEILFPEFPFGFFLAFLHVMSLANKKASRNFAGGFFCY